jgi:hypothetical protein
VEPEATFLKGSVRIVPSIRCPSPPILLRTLHLVPGSIEGPKQLDVDHVQGCHGVLS